MLLDVRCIAWQWGATAVVECMLLFSSAGVYTAGADIHGELRAAEWGGMAGAAGGGGCGARGGAALVTGWALFGRSWAVGIPWCDYFGGMFLQDLAVKGKLAKDH